MSDGPSNRDPNERPSPGRFWIWIAVLVAGAIGVLLLFRLFPARTFDDWDWLRLIWLVTILALVSTWILASRRIKLRDTARNIALWVVVVALIAVAYAFKDEFAALFRG